MNERKKQLDEKNREKSEKLRLKFLQFNSVPLSRGGNNSRNS
jgi:hypothetical protein